jgi:hypothetical protein
LQFIDLPDSKLANLVQQSGLFVSCDDSIVKFQVGPIPLLTTQEELDAKVASLFPGVPITTEIREDKSTGRAEMPGFLSLVHLPQSCLNGSFGVTKTKQRDASSCTTENHCRQSWIIAASAGKSATWRPPALPLPDVAGVTVKAILT